MFDINWGILGRAPDIAGSALSGYQTGRAMAQQERQESALAALARDPNDAAALGALMEASPETALRFQSANREAQEDNRRQAIRTAAGEWVAARGLSRAPSTLAHLSESSPIVGAGLRTSALSGATSAAPMDNALAPATMADPRYALAPKPRGVLSPMTPDGVPNDRRAPGDFSPKLADVVAVDDGADAFARYARLDPAGAMEARSKMVSMAKADLEMNEKLNDGAIRLLGVVSDQSSWDMAKRRAAAMYAQYGYDIASLDLPDAYSPEMVDNLRRQAMDARAQLIEQRNDARFQWDMEDDRRDNARADREADDRIVDRRERRVLTRRQQDMVDSRGRYGTDVASADRRRGQDQTDRRTRDSWTQGPAGRKNAAPAPVKVNTPEEARNLPPGTVFITPDGRQKVR